jgi:hypothetical protein
MKIKSGSGVVLLVPVALVLAFGILAWAQQPTHTRFDGMFASYEVSNPILDASGNFIGSEYYYVYLGESMGTGAIQVKQWRLSFTVSKTLYGSQSSRVQLTGFGPIPDASVTLGKPEAHELALLVDIPTLPTFPSPMAFSRSKTWSPSPTPNPAIDLNFGVIDLQWEWINDLWNKSQGHSVVDLGDSWRHSQGFTEENGALVWGYLFGVEVFPVEFGYPPGRIGQTRSDVTTHWK